MRPTCLSLSLLLGSLLAVAPAARAQRAPSGVSVGATVLLPSGTLGGGTLQGGEVTGTVGLTARTSLDFTYAQYRTKLSEYGTGDERPRSLKFPSLLLRVPVAGEREGNELSMLIGGGAQIYDLGATTPRQTVPSLGAGLGLKLPLVGPFSADLSVRDWINYSHVGEFTTLRGDRRVGNSIEFRVSLGAFYRRHEPSLRASLEDLPVSYTTDFRPVDASAVQREPERTTAGRDHMHTDNGAAVGVKAVDMSEFNGDKAPTGVSILVPTGPTPRYTEAVLGTVYYPAGSSAVRPAFRSLLKDVAVFLQQNPTAQVVLQGYTDPDGALRGNVSLAERRGTTLEELLARLYGIPAGRMSVTSNGIDYKAKRKELGRRVDLVAHIPKK